MNIRKLFICLALLVPTYVFAQFLTTVAPSGTLPAVPYSYNPLGRLLRSSSDTAADLTGNGTNIPSLYVVEQSFGGPNVNDGRNAISVFQNLTAATSLTNAYRYYVGVSSYVNAEANDHGTAGTPAGIIEGLTGSVQLTAPATHFFSEIGGEFTISANTGSSVYDKAVILMDEWPTDKVNGSLVDAYLWTEAHKGAVGMNSWAQIDSFAGTFPLTTTSTVLRLIGTNTIYNGLDFGSLAISSNVLQWNTAGYYLSGAGTARLSAVISGGATFTVSGCGTANSVTGGSTAGSFTVGTGATPCTFVLTMGGLGAPHGWVCMAYDVTKNLPLAPTTSVLPVSCTVTSTINGKSNPVATGDLIQFSANGY
jgi:hypothetical protein